MFYQEEMDRALRFGDVLRGYVSTTPNIEEPIIKKPILAALNEGYSIDVNLPIFSVVISPCCSIGRKVISLTPLIKLRNSFFDNPYFAEDLTRINREMEPHQPVPPFVWKRLPPEERQRRVEEGYGYAFLELFVYEKNELFPKYVVDTKQGRIKTEYYMIDFRNTYKLNCEKIITPHNSPIESKCLQLSIETRSELRSKIAYYYARVPKEDKVSED